MTPSSEQEERLKKKYDPLWEVVDEKVALQGQEARSSLCCPHCHVSVDSWEQAKIGESFRCGLCGTPCEVAHGSGESELVARAVE